MPASFRNFRTPCFWDVLFGRSYSNTYRPRGTRVRTHSAHFVLLLLTHRHKMLCESLLPFSTLFAAYDARQMNEERCKRCRVNKHLRGWSKKCILALLGRGARWHQEWKKHFKSNTIVKGPKTTLKFGCSSAIHRGVIYVAKLRHPWWSTIYTFLLRLYNRPTVL